MKTQPNIIQLEPKKLLGQRLSMSLLENKTRQLWGRFVPHIKSIKHRVSQNKISMQVYPQNYYEHFSPENVFEKWATVEVSSYKDQAEGFEAFELQGGLYAVFQYKGLSTDSSVYQYIFSEWIPNSNYSIDDRPHFEVLGEKYKNNNPSSEEEIWIPIC